MQMSEEEMMKPLPSRRNNGTRTSRLTSRIPLVSTLSHFSLSTRPRSFARFKTTRSLLTLFFTLDIPSRYATPRRLLYSLATCSHFAPNHHRLARTQQPPLAVHTARSARIFASGPKQHSFSLVAYFLKQGALDNGGRSYVWTFGGQKRTGWANHLGAEAYPCSIIPCISGDHLDAAPTRQRDTRTTASVEIRNMRDAKELEGEIHRAFGF